MAGSSNMDQPPALRLDGVESNIAGAPASGSHLASSCLHVDCDLCGSAVETQNDDHHHQQQQQQQNIAANHNDPHHSLHGSQIWRHRRGKRSQEFESLACFQATRKHWNVN